MVAVNDGTIAKVGHNKQLGNYIILQDDYGNRFTYSQLGQVAKAYAGAEASAAVGLRLQARHSEEGQRPRSRPATRGKPVAVAEQVRAAAESEARHKKSRSQRPQAPRPAPAEHRGRRAPRLYALPQRPHNVHRADVTGQIDQLMAKRFPGYSIVKSYVGGVAALRPPLDGAATAPQGLEGRRRHRPRPDRARPTSSRPTSTSRSSPRARALPRSIPSRSSTAGS